ncbi:BppU family phage baseplate upper protein [Intestinibacter bartlettii]|uniref:BppU family phage baseplate upper protein n=1 Tax=Intestinibacter bartlettii TaxID=261299 RepID=UPI0008203201|nr:BppU family phage baseplate upper protein [Intestinibacter bartlettii]SCJ12198.1 Uncharacterised protein [uncultured Clostridium sp.]
MRDYDIESDLKQEKFQSLKLVQGDRGNKIKINVYEDGQPVKLTGCSISVKYKRADGEVVNDGTIENITDNYFYAVIDSNITKVSGTLKMLFSIEKDDVKVSTFLLLADVREGLLENTGSSGGSTGGGEVTVDLSNYYKKNETYSKAQIDEQFKNYAKTTAIPTKLSQLSNDANYAKTSDIPTVPADLTLDSSSKRLQLVNDIGIKLGNGIIIPTSSSPSANDYELVSVDVQGGTLNLTTDRFQHVLVEDGMQIVLPEVYNVCEIHLFFFADVTYTIVLPDCCVQNDNMPNITENHIYEFIFTFYPFMSKWLFGYIEYPYNG